MHNKQSVKIYKGKNLTLGIASKAALEQYEFTEPTAVITIRTPKNACINLDNMNIYHILHLAFKDSDTDTDIIEKRHAIAILNFAKQNKHITIICQCEAGISRSAGVAAALSVIYNKTDKWVFDDPLFKPNMKVYRTILNNYYE